MGPSAASTLVSIPRAELFQVSGGQQRPLALGPFSVACADGQDGQTRIIAQVGEAAWELLPASQTLKVGEQTYLFSTPEAGVYQAVALGADSQPEAVGVLEAVLESVTLLRESERLLGSAEAQAGEAALAEGVTYRSGLARGIHTASASIASGLMVSATYASGMLKSASGYFTAGEPTQAPVQLSEGFKRRVQQSATVARWVSKAANSVVGGLAWLGGKVAGGVMWALGADKPPRPGEEPGTMREVSQAALGGFTEVWDSMEEAGYLVLTSARDNTAAVVEHRYGAEAGATSVEGMNAAGYAGDAFLASRRIGVRTVAKSAAKHTARGVIRKWAGGEELPGQRAGSGRSSPGSSESGGRSATPGADQPSGARGRAPVTAGRWEP